MSGKSIWAIAAGVIFIVVVSTLADAVLHVVGVSRRGISRSTTSCRCSRRRIVSRSALLARG
jgi:hypothetical protein